MRTHVNRRTVDLSGYPDLVVVYLGMRVNRITGMKTLVGFGPKISLSASSKPEGLLHHETLFYSVFPMHFGIRQYWRDLESLLSWTRSDPHRKWWQDFLKSSRGTGFWHETYFMRGGIEAIYDDMPTLTGLAQFAPLQPARGPMFSARHRAKLSAQTLPSVIDEAEFYSEDRPA